MTKAAVAIPYSSKSGRWPAWVVAAPIAVVVLVGGGWLALRALNGAPASQVTAVYHTVRPMDLNVTISKDGDLQAVNNIEVFSLVEGEAKIQSLIKEGSWVQKGTVLAMLDTAPIRQKIDETTLELQRSEADLANAREMRAIQELQNSANVEAAESELLLAKIALEQYTDGTFPQQKKDAETDLKWAKIQLTNKEEDLAQTLSLYEKGFVTAADVKKSELEVTTAQNAVSKADNALHVLVNYSNKMDLASKQNAVVQAEQRLVRVKREATSAMNQKDADLKAREQAYTLQLEKMKRLQIQLAACEITAPVDGLAVYGSSGDRNAQVQIQEGASIRERQVVFRLPDITQMKVVIRVSETQVSRLKVGQRATVRIVGVPEPIAAEVDRISVLADSGQRWWNPDLKEYPVDLKLQVTPPNLKPGMSSPATVYVAELSDVLAVPQGCIYAAGSKRFVFVRRGDRHEPIEVEIGASNESHTQISKGLKENDEVLILQSGQGRELLERAGIKVDESQGRPGGERRQRSGGGAGGEGRDASRAPAPQ